jgi:hypothetical protein
MAPQDVGLYGGLCALASFDRTELKVFFVPALLLSVCIVVTSIHEFEFAKLEIMVIISFHYFVFGRQKLLTMLASGTFLSWFQKLGS